MVRRFVVTTDLGVQPTSIRSAINDKHIELYLEARMRQEERMRMIGNIVSRKLSKALGTNVVLVQDHDEFISADGFRFIAEVNQSTHSTYDIYQVRYCSKCGTSKHEVLITDGIGEILVNKIRTDDFVCDECLNKISNKYSKKVKRSFLYWLIKRK